MNNTPHSLIVIFSTFPLSSLSRPHSDYYLLPAHSLDSPMHSTPAIRVRKNCFPRKLEYMAALRCSVPRNAVSPLHSKKVPLNYCIGHGDYQKVNCTYAVEEVRNEQFDLPPPQSNDSHHRHHHHHDNRNNQDEYYNNNNSFPPPPRQEYQYPPIENFFFQAADGIRDVMA